MARALHWTLDVKEGEDGIYTIKDPYLDPRLELPPALGPYEEISKGPGAWGGSLDKAFWQKGYGGLPPFVKDEKEPSGLERFYSEDPSAQPPPALPHPVPVIAHPAVKNVSGQTVKLYSPNIMEPEINGQMFQPVVALEYRNKQAYDRIMDPEKKTQHANLLTKAVIAPDLLGVINPVTQKREYPCPPGLVEIPPNIPLRQVYIPPPSEPGVKDFSTSEAQATLKETAVVMLDEAGLEPFMEDLEEVKALLYGTSKRTDHQGNALPSMTKLGLKTNDRSADPSPGDPSGSYSLAFTVSEGKGNGIVLPVTQTANDVVNTVRAAFVELIGGLAYRILRACLQREEFEDLTWVNEVNNMPRMGSFINTVVSSIQMNVSFLCDDLQKAIGKLQGWIHMDHKDARVGWTVFFLFFNYESALSH